MKKRVFIFVLLILSSFAFTMGRGDDLSSPNRIIGFVKWYGSAPLAIAGLETIEGQIFTLRVEENSSFALKDITQLQGHLLQLDGRIEKKDVIDYQMLKDGIFYVQKFEDLSARN